MNEKARDPASVVRELIAEFDMHPRQINAGFCERFAIALEERLGGDATFEWSKEFFAAEGAEDPDPHAYCWFGDKVYDAECPDGADDPTCLPFFRRLMDETEDLDGPPSP